MPNSIENKNAWDRTYIEQEANMAAVRVGVPSDLRTQTVRYAVSKTMRAIDRGNKSLKDPQSLRNYLISAIEESLRGAYLEYEVVRIGVEQMVDLPAPVSTEDSLINELVKQEFVKLAIAELMLQGLSSQVCAALCTDGINAAADLLKDELATIGKIISQRTAYQRIWRACAKVAERLAIHRSSVLSAIE